MSISKLVEYEPVYKKAFLSFVKKLLEATKCLLGLEKNFNRKFWENANYNFGSEWVHSAPLSTISLILKKANEEGISQKSYIIERYIYEKSLITTTIKLRRRFTALKRKYVRLRHFPEKKSQPILACRRILPVTHK